MRRLFILVLVMAVLSVIAAPSHAQDSGKRVYISDDDLIMFEHPAEWEVIELPLSLRLLDANPSIGETPTIRLDVVYPMGAPGLRRGTYAGLQPVQVIEEFQLYLRDIYDFSPNVELTLSNKAIAYTTTGNDTIMLVVMDLGRNNIGLIVAQTTGASVMGFEELILDVAETALYLGPQVDPDPTRPVTDPTGGGLVPTEETPAPSATEAPADGATPTADPTAFPTEPADAGTTGLTTDGIVALIASGAVQPAALVVDDNPADDGMVFMYYRDGDLSLFSGGIAPVDISYVRFVSPDGATVFSSDDFGYMQQRLFVPGQCIHIRSVDLPYAAPDFCTTTHELVYLTSELNTRHFVWNSAHNASDTFNVVQDDTVLATCSISAGECMFTMPPSPFALLAPQ